MRILVTRPEPDATTLAEMLRDRGHEPIVSPLTILEFIPCDLATAAPTATIAGIVVTSRNALRGIARVGVPAGLQSLPLFCVGEDTAEMARDMGFRTVITGPGDAAGLAKVVRQDVPVQAGCLLRLTGEMASKAPQRLSDALRNAGYDVRDVLCYRTTPHPSLTPQAITALTRNEVDLVVLMSPLAASTYLQAIAFAGLTVRSENTKYVCLSQAVADALVGVPREVKKIADKPNQSGLLSVIDHDVAKLS